MFHIFIVCLSGDAYCEKIATNMDEQVSLYRGIESFGNMFRNSVAGSHSVTISCFFEDPLH